MAAERTELAWAFTPADQFEAAYEGAHGGALLSISDGKAVVTLNGPKPAPAIEEDLRQWVLTVLRVRAIQTDRSFELKGSATATEFKDGRSHIYVRVEPVVIRITAGRVDVVQTDASGAVVRDTRAERIENERSEIEDVAAKALTNPVLTAMLESFVTALSDREGEFVRLYEIRDALAKHVGNDGNAKAALSISSGDWSKFGQLANNAPVIEGRHRGSTRTRCAQRPQRNRRRCSGWRKNGSGNLRVFFRDLFFRRPLSNAAGPGRPA